MLKKLALILAILLIVFFLWFSIAFPYGSFVTINGRAITGPLGAALSAVLTAVILFCVAILLAFVFAGVGLIVLGCLVLVGFVLTAVTLPFLLPILIPLFIVWLVCILAGRTRTI
jgi:hypothetical protein